MEIKSWEDWFDICGKVSPQLEKYEKLVYKYFSLVYPLDQIQKKFENRHKTHFYNDAPIIPKHKLVRSILIGFIFFLVSCSAVIAVSMISPLIPVASGLESMNLISKIKVSMLFGLSAFIFSTSLILLVHIAKLSILRHKLKVIEKNISNEIKYIPPKYRNSVCTKYFYEAYKLYNSSYESAMSSCDEYMYQNNLVANYMSVMFDKPMETIELENKFEDYEESIPEVEFNNSTVIDNNWNIVDNIDVDIPNLPEDIKQHTYAGIPDAEKYLNSMVGLNSIKETVRQMKNRMSFYKDGNNKISGNHMVFLGSPGTGKSTVARVITTILSDFGYINGNLCVEIDGNYLKSPYSGQSSEITSAVIQYCEEIGACLFIDEAYTLLDNSSSSKESLTVLLQSLENKKDSLVVIFAGYEDDINRLISSNQGFASRIKYKLYFDDYSEDELIQIFYQMLNSYSSIKYEVENQGILELKRQFTLEKQLPGFGNARVVRNALDRILDIHADRFMKGEIEKEHKYIIEKADIIEYINDHKKQIEEDRRNFLANNDLDSSIITIQDLKSHTKPGSSNPSEELESMIGLDTIKKEITQLIAQYQFYDGDIGNFGHCLFVGPSGTGKSTLAKIMTGWLYKLGLISENRYFDCTGAYLQGSFTGHTAKRTEAICQYATGGVLFIDEAYSLIKSDGNTSEYGSEAIAVLIDFMEKNRGNLVVIFAGYEKEMSDFLNSNTGIKSRITNTFHFENYTPYEMANIMNLYAKNDKFKIEQDCWKPIQYYLLDESKKPNFGNARDVRNLWDKFKKQHIYNYSQNMYDESKKYCITYNDIKDII